MAATRAEVCSSAWIPSVLDRASLYGFLYSFGYQEIIETQWQEAVQCDDFNKACVLLGMLGLEIGDLGDHLLPVGV